MNSQRIGKARRQKPDWWPRNPYPESIFPMPEERYSQIVLDPDLRIGLSGLLGRQFWDIASDAIWEAMLAEDEWTTTWPIEPGHYWFYGWCSKPMRRDYDPEMILVKVRKTRNSVAYVGDGRFIYEAEGAVGLWKRAQLPKPPAEELAALLEEQDG